MCLLLSLFYFVLFAEQGSRLRIGSGSVVPHSQYTYWLKGRALTLPDSQYTYWLKGRALTLPHSQYTYWLKGRALTLPWSPVLPVSVQTHSEEEEEEEEELNTIDLLGQHTVGRKEELGGGRGRGGRGGGGEGGGGM